MTVLARFLRDLEAQSPRPVDGPAPDLARHSPEDVRAARRAWSGRVVDEQRSVVVFAELLRLLAEVAAPFQALVAVQRLLGDELRHVQLCRRLATELDRGREPSLDLAGLGLPPSDAPPAARAYEIVVRELVLAESESVRVLGEYRRAATDPAARHALDVLLVDEARHVAAGLALEALLRATLPQGDVGQVRDHLPELVALDLGHMRDAYRAAATGGPGRALGASLRPDDLTWREGELGSPVAARLLR